MSLLQMHNNKSCVIFNVVGIHISTDVHFAKLDVFYTSLSRVRTFFEDLQFSPHTCLHNCASYNQKVILNSFYLYMS